MNLTILKSERQVEVCVCACVCVCVCVRVGGGAHYKCEEAVRVDWDPWSLPLVLPLKTCSMIEARTSLGRLLDLID